MLIVLEGFRGERPALDARLIEQNEAQLAENTKLWRGAIEPWYAPSAEFNVGSGEVLSIFRYQPEGQSEPIWMRWSTDVDVARSPVAGSDELYWTGDGAPKIGNHESISGGTPYAAFNLGVPAPETALTAAETDPAEDPKTGTIASITPLLEVGGLVGSDSFASTPNRSPYSVESELETEGLMQFAIHVDANFPQRKAYTSDFTVWVEMDPATSSPGSGTEIFRKTVVLSLPKATGHRNQWTTDDYPASDYTFTYAPVPGTHTFRIWTQHGFKSTNDGGDPDNRKQYATVQASNGRLLLDLGTTDHGLVEGDRIQLSGVVGTGTLEQLNAGPVTIVGFHDAQTAIIEAPGITGVYDDDPPATWTQVFDEVEKQVRSYVYTYIVMLGEHDMESAPSPPSNFVAVADGASVTLTGFAEPPDDGRAYAKMRVYRLAVGDASEEYLFVGEIDLDTFDFETGNQYVDTLRGTDLGRPLPSQYKNLGGQIVRWDEPPEDMKGLIELPNGMLAAFRGNELLLCEPYQPHAWPVAYRRAVSDEIVALGAFGASIVVTTKGRPTIFTGVEPGSLSEENVETAYPNLSKRGTVDLGYAVVYPSLRGKVMVSQGGAKIITDGLFTDNQWEALNPASFVAAKYGSRYIWFYESNEWSAVASSELTVAEVGSGEYGKEFGAGSMNPDPLEYATLSIRTIKSAPFNEPPNFIIAFDGLVPAGAQTLRVHSASGTVSFDLQNPDATFADGEGTAYVWNGSAPWGHDDQGETYLVEILATSEGAGYILDPLNPGATLTRLTMHSSVAWSDPKTDELYVLADLLPEEE